MMMKFVKRYLVTRCRYIYRYVNGRLSGLKNKNKSAEEVFTNIYHSKKWGIGGGMFCSGPGSFANGVVFKYVESIMHMAYTEGFYGLRFVDLGCGDFQVGRHLIEFSSHYIGIDVVKPLIEYNEMIYGNDRVHFLCMDIVTSELPSGDVCFIRQVFQHLSNKQILGILSKLSCYKWVFVTDQYPIEEDVTAFNADLVHGPDTRIIYGSGVFLTEPPFSVPPHSIEFISEIPWSDDDGSPVHTVIRTYLYRPMNNKF